MSIACALLATSRPIKSVGDLYPHVTMFSWRTAKGSCGTTASQTELSGASATKPYMLYEYVHRAYMAFSLS